MANISQFEANGVVHTYDKESRNPLALKNVKKAFEGTLVYGTDESGMAVPLTMEQLVSQPSQPSQSPQPML